MKSNSCQRVSSSFFRSEFVEGGLLDRLAATPSAAGVENELLPGPDGVVGDEIELLPQGVELFFPLIVEQHLAQRGIVAEVAHHVVKAGSEQASFVVAVTVDGIKTPVLPAVECG